MRKTIIVVLLTFVFSLAAFAGDVKMENRNGVDPGAKGNIKTGVDKNGNTNFTVNVAHLATPQELTPPHQNYVVWIQAQGDQPQIVGEMKVGQKKEMGSVKGTTAAKVFDVFVTAEDTASPSAPSSTEVLHGHVDRS